MGQPSAACKVGEHDRPGEHTHLVQYPQAAAGDARAALAALLVGVDARRRCDFLELVTAGMHAGLLFFERGHQARQRSPHACSKWGYLRLFYIRGAAELLIGSG